MLFIYDQHVTVPAASGVQKSKVIMPATTNSRQSIAQAAPSPNVPVTLSAADCNQRDSGPSQRRYAERLAAMAGN